MHSPLNSYAYIHWILDFKYILLFVDIEKAFDKSPGGGGEMGVEEAGCG